jgi:hypothetical protein
MSKNADRATLDKMVAHHRMMAAQLRHGVARLAGAAGEGYGMQAIEAVHSYLESEVFPHARAEERTVFAAASAAGLSTLVEEMVREHRHLFAEAEKLTHPEAEGDALDTARGIASLFAVHAEKENASILAPLAGDPDVDLESLLRDMESMLPTARDRDLDFVVPWQLPEARTG